MAFPWATAGTKLRAYVRCGSAATRWRGLLRHRTLTATNFCNTGVRSDTASCHFDDRQDDEHVSFSCGSPHCQDTRTGLRMRGSIRERRETKIAFQSISIRLSNCFRRRHIDAYSGASEMILYGCSLLAVSSKRRIRASCLQPPLGWETCPLRRPPRRVPAWCSRPVLACHLARSFPS